MAKSKKQKYSRDDTRVIAFYSKNQGEINDLNYWFPVERPYHKLNHNRNLIKILQEKQDEFRRNRFT